MSQPDLKPLSTGELDDFERALLDSVTDDAGPDEGRKRTLAALGLSATSAAPATHDRSLRSRLWSDLSKTKLVALGIVALGSSLAVSKFAGYDAAPVVTAASAPIVPHAAAPREEAPIAQPPVVPESTAPEKVTPGTITPETITPEKITPEKLPTATRPSSSAAAKAPASEAHRTDDVDTPASTLAREIAAIEAARSELSRGRTASTLTLLDAYDKEFPRGAFTVEVGALRIEALSREGRSVEVERLAAAFLSAYPTGVYTRRVEEARARARSGKPSTETQGAPRTASPSIGEQ